MSEIKDWSPILNAYYREKCSNKHLVETFGIQNVSPIHKQFPEHIHESLKCEYCNVSLKSAFLNKTAKRSHEELVFDIRVKPPYRSKPVLYRNSYFNNYLLHSGSAYQTEEGYLVTLPVCSDCGHSPVLSCDCEGCKSLKEFNTFLVAGELKERYEEYTDVPAPNFESLSCRQIYKAIFALRYCSLTHNTFKLPFESDEKTEIIKSGLFILDEDSIKQAVSMKSVIEYELNEEFIPFAINANLTAEECLNKLKVKAAMALDNSEKYLEILDLWSEIALAEALGVLKQCCEEYKLPYKPGEQTVSVIKKSLSKYGLAQTARYIFNSVRYANDTGTRKSLSKNHTFNLICGNMNFWVDADRARDFKAPPFFRGSTYLCEPESAIAFSHSFLELHGIDYFKDPIRIAAKKPEPSEQIEEKELQQE